ncbi:MAG TPA: lipid droplet-associated protein [Pseudonocardiaceae bacterium]|jgi:hypothetical protein
MNPLPLPVRVAAGLLATALEEARKLPEQLAELPVTTASRAIQAGMRMQQRVTALAVKGDEVFSLFRPVEDTPSWARFDEDEEEITDESTDEPATPPRPDEDGLATVVPGPGARRHGEADEAMIARALSSEHSEHSERSEHEDTQDDAAADSTESSSPNGAAQAVSQHTGTERAGTKAGAPDALPEYDELTLPQLRGKLRALSLSQLEELLAHEQANRERPPFVTMLSNRIVTVRAQ